MGRVVWSRGLTNYMTDGAMCKLARRISKGIGSSIRRQTIKIGYLEL